MNLRIPDSHFFALDNRMTVVLFAGMGGGCDGLEDAGFHVHLAINHDPVAVAVHQARHPHTRHERCDVFEVDPRKATRGRGVRVLHASPDCTHFSVAKGGKPVSKRRRSLAWVVCRWAGQVRPETITLENVPEIQTWGGLIAKRDKVTGRVMRLDGTVAAKGERVPVQEQWLVPDPKKKGRIWRAWLRHMHGCGYNFEGRVLVCADYGVPTIRKRFFGVAHSDGSPIIWPGRTHAPRHLAKRLGLKPWVGAHTIVNWSLPVRSIFGRKKDLAEASLRRTARGLWRYVVNAAKPFIVPITHSGGPDRVHSIDDPLRTLTTAHRGELSIVVPSVSSFIEGVGGRAAQSEPRGMDVPFGSATTKEDRVLVSAHLQRQFGESVGADLEDPAPTIVADGQGKTALVAAHLVGLAHGDSARGGSRREYDLEEPATTIHAGGGNQALVAAFLAQHSAGSHPGNPAKDPLEPLSTITSSGSQQGVVAASMLALRGTNRNGRDAEEPLATLTAKGLHAGIIAASLAEMRGRSPGGRDIGAPLAAQTGKGNAHLILAFLQHYFSNGKTEDDLNSPLGALTAKARHGLVTVKVGGDTFVITDIGMRMLEPEEGAAAHGFRPGSLPDTVTIDGKTRRLTKTEKYHLVGNSVPPRMVRLLAECNVRREFAEAAE